MIQELFKSLVDSLLGRGVSRSDRTAGEIRDLNRKIHDALVGVEDAMKSERGLGGKTVNRLRLNAPRIKKYDETIHDDINTLLSLFKKGIEPDTYRLYSSTVTASQILRPLIRLELDIPDINVP